MCKVIYLKADFYLLILPELENSIVLLFFSPCIALLFFGIRF